MMQIKRVGTKNKKLNLICRMAAIWYIALGTMTYFNGTTDATFTDDATVEVHLQASEWEVPDEGCEEKTDQLCAKVSHFEEESADLEYDQNRKDNKNAEEPKNIEENLEEPENQNQDNTSVTAPVEEQTEPSIKQEGQVEESVTESTDKNDVSKETEEKESSSNGDSN